MSKRLNEVREVRKKVGLIIEKLLKATAEGRLEK